MARPPGALRRWLVRLVSGRTADVDASAPVTPTTEPTRRLASAPTLPSDYSFPSESTTGEVRASYPPTLEPGHRVGEFRIEREIGRGGMGHVYLATQESLGRQVALKILSPRLLISARAVTEFRREARAAARLRHPNVVQVYSVGDDDGLHYIAMEYVPGRDLVEELRRRQGDDGPQHVGWAAGLVADVADALHAAHLHGIIHRDVKPHNILVDGAGRARLADFGLAKDLGETSLTRTGELIGTPAYASPEQARGVQPLDHRTDVYSLGVVLYELLTRRRLHAGRSYHEVLLAIAQDEPPALRRLNRAVPGDLETICLRAMAPDPDERYWSADEMAHDLRRFLAGEPIRARRPSPLRRLRDALRRHRLAVTVMLAVGLALTAAGLLAQAWARDRGRMEVVVEPPLERVELREVLESGRLGEPIASASGPTVRRWLAPGSYRVLGRGGGEDAEVTRQLAAGETVRVRLRAYRRDELVATMARIPERSCRFGRDSGAAFESEREIRMSAYWLDRHEVTNAEYVRFIAESGHPLRPPLWDHVDPDDPYVATLPVVGVSVLEARAFCEARGKRLPTAHEWECAVRGDDDRRRPWGDGPAPKDYPVPGPEAFYLFMRGGDAGAGYALYQEYVLPVDSLPSLATPDGLHHMFGNVMEWTGTATERGWVFKGGAWYDPPDVWDLSRTATVPDTFVMADVGFRCARSAR